MFEIGLAGKLRPTRKAKLPSSFLLLASCGESRSIVAVASYNNPGMSKALYDATRPPGTQL
jgi:hypothetical protein